MCVHFCMQKEDVLEHINVKCYLCALSSTCRPLCDVGIHPITLLNILMPRCQQADLNAKCHEATLMVKLLVMGVTQHTPQNKVSDIVTHVALNTINGVVCQFRHVVGKYVQWLCHKELMLQNVASMWTLPMWSFQT